MKCYELTAAINALPKGCDTSCFFYQKIPGYGSYNPSIGDKKPNSLPEFNLLTTILGWNQNEYVAVRSLSSGVELYPTSDQSHKDDVLDVFPGNVAAIIGTA